MWRGFRIAGRFYDGHPSTDLASHRTVTDKPAYPPDRVRPPGPARNRCAGLISATTSAEDTSLGRRTTLWPGPHHASIPMTGILAGWVLEAVSLPILPGPILPGQGAPLR